MQTYIRAGAVALGSLLLTAGAHANDATLQVERLNWAGVKLTGNDTTVFIDAIAAEGLQGEAQESGVAVDADTRRRYALVTHPHNDHFDVELLQRVLGDRGYVVAHESMATYIASRGFRVIPVSTWQPVERGGFSFLPVPAADGFGDEQVSWIVSFGERRFIHAGDTLWHGQLGLIGRQYGPFDAAFLPINGVRVQTEPPTQTPATMTPSQAVDAALLLRAERLVPIHYGGSAPPFYVETDAPLSSLEVAAADRGIRIAAIGQGEALALD